MSEITVTIDDLITRFKAEYASLYQRCCNPVAAQGECDYTSEVFVEFIKRVAPGIDADSMVCVGCHDWTNHSWLPEKILFEMYWHVLVRIGGHYVDWTIRQFDINAPVPTIYTEDQLRAIWRQVSTYAEYRAAEVATEATKLRNRLNEVLGTDTIACADDVLARYREYVIDTGVITAAADIQENVVMSGYSWAFLPDGRGLVINRPTDSDREGVIASIARTRNVYRVSAARKWCRLSLEMARDVRCNGKYSSAFLSIGITDTSTTIMRQTMSHKRRLIRDVSYTTYTNIARNAVVLYALIEHARLADTVYVICSDQDWATITADNGGGHPVPNNVVRTPPVVARTYMRDVTTRLCADATSRTIAEWHMCSCR
jgi:hypothetical protein